MSDERHEFIGHSGKTRIAERAFAEAISDQPLTDFHYEILNLARQLRERDERIKGLSEKISVAGCRLVETQDRAESAERKLAEAEEAIRTIPFVPDNHYPIDGCDCLNCKWANLPAVRRALGEEEG